MKECIIIPNIDIYKNSVYLCFVLRGINMEEMKESIAFMQKYLNQLVEGQENDSCPSSKIYLLSVMLDQEIVRYYKSLTRISY